jgi:general secretion pathway protein K
MLVIVLWVMGLISLGIGALVARSQHELRLSYLPLQSVQREAIAQAALHQAVALLARDDPAEDHLAEPWATGVEQGTQILEDAPVGDGAFRVGVTDDGGAFHAGLQDEQAKIHLNTADVATLVRLIASANLGDVDPALLAGVIIDWRTKDEPEAGPCSVMEPPCHNGPLDTVEELRLVPGVTPELFAALEPYVTVFAAGDPSLVNINTASARVLDALGCAGEDLITQRSQNAPPVLAPSECAGTGSTSDVFSVPIETWLSRGSLHSRRRAVIARDGTVLAWQIQ